MKTTLKSLMLLIAAVAFSCGGDEENGPGYEFIDQDAAGEIGNVSWVYADGFASIVDFGGGEIRVSVDLTLIQDEEGCDIFIAEGDAFFFSVPNEVGLYKLKMDNVGTDSYTVTLYDDDEATNYLVVEGGAVEILAISGTEVSGRIDARHDSQTFVNGNFTVSICP